MNAKLLLLSTLAVLGTLLAAGCGGDDTAAPAAAKPAAEAAAPAKTEPAPSPTPEQPAPPAAAPGNSGAVAKQLTEKIEIPSYYPEDGPVYPGAQPSQAQQLPSGKVSLVFGTDAMPPEAASVMSEAAEAKGWSIESENQIERGFLTQAEKSGRKLVMLTSRVEDGVTLVVVSVDP